MTGLLMVLALLLPSCPTEDSSNCHWNAAEQGNGVGHSFVNFAGITWSLS